MATQQEIMDAFSDLVLEALTKRCYKIKTDEGEELTMPLDTAMVGHIRQFLKDYPADRETSIADIDKLVKLPFAQMAMRKAEKRDKRDDVTNTQKCPF